MSPPRNKIRPAPAQMRTKLGAEASAAQKSSQVAPIRKVAVIRATAKPVSAPNRNGHVSGKDPRGQRTRIHREPCIHVAAELNRVSHELRFVGVQREH